MFWPFTVWMNCSSDLKNFANHQLSALNFKSFSQSLEAFFLTVGQNNFGNKLPFYNRKFFFIQTQKYVRGYQKSCPWETTWKKNQNNLVLFSYFEPEALYCFFVIFKCMTALLTDTETRLQGKKKAVQNYLLPEPGSSRISSKSDSDSKSALPPPLDLGPITS